MNDFRCKHCNRLLLREEIVFGKFEIKCPKCGMINEFKYTLDEEKEKITGVFYDTDPIN